MPQNPKKLFAEPEMVVYGDIRSITQNVANNSMVLDGGSGSMQKTS